jgi:hypothetical protein
MMATSPNQDGVEGTDSGEVWILTADDAILLMIPPLKDRLTRFFPFREAHFFPLYNLFLTMDALTSLRISWADGLKEYRSMKEYCILVKT